MTEQATNDLVKRLRKLAAKATPLGWFVQRYGGGDSLVVHSDQNNRVCFMAVPGARDQVERRKVRKRIQADAALIVALRNDAVRIIEQQQAEIERLRGLLANLIDEDPCWLDHHGYCQTHRIEKECSVAAARAALKETGQ